MILDLVRMARQAWQGCLGVRGNWIHGDGLWVCCRCDTVHDNGRDRCRSCGHDRCPEKPKDGADLASAGKVGISIKPAKGTGLSARDALGPARPARRRT